VPHQVDDVQVRCSMEQPPRVEVLSLLRRGLRSSVAGSSGRSGAANSVLTDEGASSAAGGGSDCSGASSATGSDSGSSRSITSTPSSEGGHTHRAHGLSQPCLGVGVTCSFHSVINHAFDTRTDRKALAIQ